MITVKAAKSKAYEFYVDDVDSWVNEYDWYPHDDRTQNVVYFFRWIGKHTAYNYKNKRYLHKEIMSRQGEILKGKDVHHINNNTLDNRRCNLKAVDKRMHSHKQNHCHHSVSGYTGVNPLMNNGHLYWRVQLKRDDCMICLIFKEKTTAAFFADGLLKILYYDDPYLDRCLNKVKTPKELTPKKQKQVDKAFLKAQLFINGRTQHGLV